MKTNKQININKKYGILTYLVSSSFAQLYGVVGA